MSPSSTIAASTGIGVLGPFRSGTYRKFRIPTLVASGIVWVTDFLGLTTAGLIAAMAARRPHVTAPTGEALLLAIIGAWAGVTLLQRLKSYRLAAVCAPNSQVGVVLAALIGGMACFVAGAAVQHRGEGVSATLAATWGLAALALTGSTRILTSALISRWCACGRVARHVALIGTEAENRAVLAQFDARYDPSIHVVGVYDWPSWEGQPVLDGAPQPDFKRQLLDSGFYGGLDAVVLAFPEADDERVAGVRAALDGLAVDVYAAAPRQVTNWRNITRLGNVPAGLISGRPLTSWQETQKTIFDRIGAFLLLVMLSPLLIMIGIAVRLESPGPPLFRQSRIGRHNVPFTCIKFRTMYVHAADASGVRQAVRGDRRVTRFGAWLRRTSVDELPQLINVLRGEMSLVGPRPHAPNTCAEGRPFEGIVPNYHHRHKVRPGITGWAQVNGWRGETRTVESLEERVRHDLYYVQNWSMLFDLRILLRTALVMVHDPAAY